MIGRSSTLRMSSTTIGAPVLVIDSRDGHFIDDRSRMCSSARRFHGLSGASLT